MARKGAYVIIDLSDYNITSTGSYTVTIPGIYDKLESTTKPVLISGLTIEGKVYRDAFAECQVSGSDIAVYLDHIKWTGPAGVVNNVTLTVKADDSISII